MTGPMACAAYGALLFDLSAHTTETLECLACTVLEEQDVRAESGPDYSSAISEWPGARLLDPGTVPRELAQPVGEGAATQDLDCRFAARLPEGLLYFGQSEAESWWVLGEPAALDPWLRRHAAHVEGQHGLWVPA